MATAEVVKRAGQQVAAAAASNGGTGQQTVFDLIKQSEGAIRRALPAHFGGSGDKDEAVQRFARIALTTIRNTPKLIDCTAQSLMGALMVAAQLGMEPGGPLQQIYLVPYGDEVTLQIGYRGIIELFRRSGQFKAIAAHEVCANDAFAYRYGTEPYLDHTPALGDRGDVIAYYAVASFRSGGSAFTVMSRSEIDKRRNRSASKNNGPWKTDYDAMARKTCIRALAPYLPLSPELERQIAGDEKVYRRVEPDMIEDGVADLPALEAGSGAELGEGEPTAGGSPEPDEADPERPFE